MPCDISYPKNRLDKIIDIAKPGYHHRWVGDSLQRYPNIRNYKLRDINDSTEYPNYKDPKLGETT